ncbi:hypothetical protein CJ218_00385 [Gemella sanguinis]|uniref:SAP domain-containing protein n=2 Tax=Gemella sanguinis TaxID=84135 RepID=A0A2N6SHH7_9BACL|nr:hypothetical protein CJ218_00385 [Gemella sanguinis]QGS08333.1 hypothetical protein FOC50_02200 [Gemella sanguinis]
MRYDERISLNKLKVEELKEILVRGELKVTGKKNDLIERIIEECDKRYYQRYLELERYITDKGEKLLARTKFVLVAHSNNIAYPVDIYNFYLNNQSSDELDLICDFIECKVRFDKETKEISDNSYLYYQLSQVCNIYNNQEKQLYYLLKSCYEFISTDTPYFRLINIKEFKNYVNRLSFHTKDISLLLQSNQDLKENMESYINSLEKTYYNNYFNNDEIKNLIIAFCLKNSYEVDRIIVNIYKRNQAEGKFDGNISDGIYEYCYPQKIEDEKKEKVSLINKIVSWLNN